MLPSPPLLYTRCGCTPTPARLLEVAVVHVCVHAEQALEDGLGHVHEVGREGGAELLREDLVVVDLWGR